MAVRSVSRAFHTPTSILRYTDGPKPVVMEIFDGPLKAAHRDRASLYPIEPDPLVDEVRDRLLERLLDCTRDFKNALVLGGSGWQVLQALHANSSRTSLSSASKRASGGIEKVTLMDTSPGMLDRARRNWERLKSDSWHHAGPGFDARGMPSYGTAHEQEEGNLPTGKPTSLEADFVLADAETEVLPVEPKSFDVVISCLGLHWINDVPVSLMP